MAKTPETLSDPVGRMTALHASLRAIERTGFCAPIPRPETRNARRSV